MAATLRQPRRSSCSSRCSELRAALQERGGDLVIAPRHARARAAEAGARARGEAVYFASDVSPFALARDRRVEAALREAGVEPRRTPGQLRRRHRQAEAVRGLHAVLARLAGAPRRAVHGAPRAVPVPADLRAGEIPSLERSSCARTSRAARRRDAPAARRCTRGCATGSRTSRPTTGSPAARRCSRPYLHFGCVSARELEQRAGRHDAYTRQLAWRDFYAHVLLHHPGNARHAYRRELDGDRVGRRGRALRRLARGPHGLSGGRRGDAPAGRDRLDAQPRAADHRVLPGQGPAHRLAPRRAALHAAAARRRPGQQQRQLARVSSHGACSPSRLLRPSAPRGQLRRRRWSPPATGRVRGRPCSLPGRPRSGQQRVRRRKKKGPRSRR